MISTLTRDEHRQLQEYLFDNPSSAATAALLMLLCGLRTYEACHATRDDLLPQAATPSEIRIPQETAKRGQARTLPLPGPLVALFSKRYNLTPQLALTPQPTKEPLCPNEDYDPISNRWLQKYIRRLGYKLLGHGITPYTLRHTCASRLRHKTDIATLMTILGHRNLKSTQVYLHPTADEIRAALEASNADY